MFHLRNQFLNQLAIWHKSAFFPERPKNVFETSTNLATIAAVHEIQISMALNNVLTAL